MLNFFLKLIFIIFINLTAYSSIEYEVENDLLIRSLDAEDTINDNLFRKKTLNDDGEEIGSNLEKKFVTIPLGCNCQPSFKTRECGVRGHAFPFDWCFTPYESLYHFIDTDFKDFFKKENLIQSDKKLFKDFVYQFCVNQNGTHISESPGWVLDKESGMFFIHDFTNGLPETIEREHAVHHAKYLRRINRFYSEINSGKHVYFIRFGAITKAQSISLVDLLKRKFPNLKFTLIVIESDYQEFFNDWGVPYLKNFFAINADAFDWATLCKSMSRRKLK
jgi:hypothetical protein